MYFPSLWHRIRVTRYNDADPEDSPTKAFLNRNLKSNTDNHLIRQSYISFQGAAFEISHRGSDFTTDIPIIIAIIEALIFQTPRKEHYPNGTSVKINRSATSKFKNRNNSSRMEIINEGNSINGHEVKPRYCL